MSCICAVSDIPASFAVKDLRAFFSDYIERELFDVFHFLPTQPALAPALARPDTLSCAVSLVNEQRAAEFVRAFDSRQWVSAAGEHQARLCRVRHVAADATRHGTATDTQLFLAQLPQPRAHPLLPRGNVGTPTSFIIGLVADCRLSQSAVRKLGIRAPQSFRRAAVPFDYASLRQPAPAAAASARPARRGFASSGSSIGGVAPAGSAVPPKRQRDDSPVAPLPATCASAPVAAAASVTSAVGTGADDDRRGHPVTSVAAVASALCSDGGGGGDDDAVGGGNDGGDRGIEAGDAEEQRGPSDDDDGALAGDTEYQAYLRRERAWRAARQASGSADAVDGGATAPQADGRRRAQPGGAGAPGGGVSGGGGGGGGGVSGGGGGSGGTCDRARGEPAASDSGDDSDGDSDSAETSEGEDWDRHATWHAEREQAHVFHTHTKERLEQVFEERVEDVWDKHDASGIVMYTDSFGREERARARGEGFDDEAVDDWDVDATGDDDKDRYGGGYATEHREPEDPSEFRRPVRPVFSGPRAPVASASTGRRAHARAVEAAFTRFTAHGIGGRLLRGMGWRPGEALGGGPRAKRARAGGGGPAARAAVPRFEPARMPPAARGAVIAPGRPHAERAGLGAFPHAPRNAAARAPPTRHTWAGTPATDAWVTIPSVYDYRRAEAAAASATPVVAAAAAGDEPGKWTQSPSGAGGRPAGPVGAAQGSAAPAAPSAALSVDAAAWRAAWVPGPVQRATL